MFFSPGVLSVCPFGLALNIRIRGMSEHNGHSHDYELDLSRTTLWSNPLLEATLTPFYVNYHLEHHLFPQVPYFHLKSLHEKLMTNELFKQDAAISLNYLKNLIKGL